MSIDADPSDFFLELPELTFDPVQLLSITDEISDYWKPFIDHTGVDNGYSHLRHPSNKDRPYIKELKNRLTFLIDRHRITFIRLPPNYELHPHLDERPSIYTIPRQAAIIFPLTPGDETGAPIRWHNENGEVVMEHNYSNNYATLINTQRLHSVRNNGFERINFQFSIYEQFSDCVARYNEGTFFRP